MAFVAVVFRSRTARLLWGLLLPLVLFWGNGMVQAQGRAAVSGFVTDSSDGQPLTGANVLLQRVADSTVSYGGATDEDGVYLLKGIRPGRYELQI